MTRIIAGLAGGRRLAVPARGTRPTSDRVRESLFSALDSLLSGDTGWTDVTVLDLYAGTGALGLEALSRGARTAYLVESDRAALRILRDNCAAVGLPGAQVRPVRVASLVGLPPPDPAASLVLVDPPYVVASRDIADVLSGLAAAGWIAADAHVAVERPARDLAVPLPAHWHVERERRYGDTTLWYGRASSAKESG